MAMILGRKRGMIVPRWRAIALTTAIIGIASEAHGQADGAPGAQGSAFRLQPHRGAQVAPSVVPPTPKHVVDLGRVEQRAAQSERELQDIRSAVEAQGSLAY